MLSDNGRGALEYSGAKVAYRSVFRDQLLLWRHEGVTVSGLPIRCFGKLQLPRFGALVPWGGEQLLRCSAVAPLGWL
jgi:hypothetical protein